MCSQRIDDFVEECPRALTPTTQRLRVDVEEQALVRPEARVAQALPHASHQLALVETAGEKQRLDGGLPRNVAKCGSMRS